MLMVCSGAGGLYWCWWSVLMQVFRTGAGGSYWCWCPELVIMLCTGAGGLCTMLFQMI